MKISEFIRKLQAIEREFGDLDLYLEYENETFAGILPLEAFPLTKLEPGDYPDTLQELTTEVIYLRLPEGL